MPIIRKPSWTGRYLPAGAVSMTVAPVQALRNGRIVRARDSRRGLGVDLRVDPVTLQTIDCDSWSNFFNATCWGVLTTKGTQSYVYSGTPYLSTVDAGQPPVLAKGATAPPIVAGTVSTLPAGSQDNPAALIGQQIANQTAENQAANQQFFADLSAQNQFAGGGCSQNILSGVCDWVTVAGGVGLGLVVLLLARGRR